MEFDVISIRKFDTLIDLMAEWQDSEIDPTQYSELFLLNALNRNSVTTPYT